MTRWYDTEAGRARLERDRRIVEELQPELRYEESEAALHLVGNVVFHTESGIPHRIPIQIEFPDDYPSSEPIARDITNRFLPHDPDHHFIGDRLCLWVDIESRYRPDDPAGLRAVLTEVAVQLLRLLVWENDPEGGYPGAARAHGARAYAEIVAEALRVDRSVATRMWRALAGNVSRNSRCPCGSAVRYRRCHRDRIERFRAAHAPQDVAVVAEILRRLAFGIPFSREKETAA